VLLVLGVGVVLWQGDIRVSDVAKPDDPALLTKPVWVDGHELKQKEQVAGVQTHDFDDETVEGALDRPADGMLGVNPQMAAKQDDTEMIVGGKPQRERDARGYGGGTVGTAARDEDFQACETASGDEAIAACDRAIASGRFSGRMLSYLYNDRGFLRMQKAELENALADLNEAARIDSTNFFAFWNRGAVYSAKGDFTRAETDLTTALSLKPDKTSKAQIEEALKVVTAAKAAGAQPSDRSVITVPTWENQDHMATSGSAYPTDAMPTAPAFPASPPPLAVSPPTVMPPAPSPMPVR
jgi:hypothetical protein